LLKSVLTELKQLPSPAAYVEPTQSGGFDLRVVEESLDQQPFSLIKEPGFGCEAIPQGIFQQLFVSSRIPVEFRRWNEI
jgi:hypothetical protein